MTSNNYSTDVCAYVSDAEGNLDYFVAWCKISKVVELVEDSNGYLVPFQEGKLTKMRMEFKDKRGNAKMCFGGDSQDKGIGDIRIVLLLLDFQKRYKNRVHFIIGNRDCNKLRLAGELSKDALDSDEVARDKGFPYWVPEDKRVTPEDALAKDGNSGNKAADRLKWMLKHTMGSDGAFERRRLELMEMRGGDVTDGDVVKSYMESVNPKASEDEQFMLRYLRGGVLGFTFGKTLFVHGGLSDLNFGHVPGDATEYESLTDWIVALNKWKVRDSHLSNPFPTLQPRAISPEEVDGT